MAAAKKRSKKFDFSAAEAGAGAAAALRSFKFQTELAPFGRYAAAIATLRDLSETAALEFERAALADLHAEVKASELHLHRGMRLSEKLKTALGAEMAIELPDFLRRKN